MPTKRLSEVTLENVKIIYRNFSGKELEFNTEGNRNFVVLLNEDVALSMLADGWNIKWTKPREGEEEDYVPMGKLHVAVSYPPKSRFGPRVVMITHKGKTPIPEELVGMLDFVRISHVDLTLNPSHWTVRGESGIKAYLASIYITIEEDYLELKYADLPEEVILPD